MVTMLSFCAPLRAHPMKLKTKITAIKAGSGLRGSKLSQTSTATSVQSSGVRAYPILRKPNSKFLVAIAAL